MKSFIVFIAIIYILNLTLIRAHPPATTAVPLKSTYDNKFDNVDLDEILNQERLLKNYINCLEGTGPCTADGRMLKVTSNFRNSAGRNADQLRQMYGETKNGSEKVTRFLIDNRPEDWQRLEKIYDPQGLYREDYLKSKIITTTTTEVTTGTESLVNDKKDSDENK